MITGTKKKVTRVRDSHSRCQKSNPNVKETRRAHGKEIYWDLVYNSWLDYFPSYSEAREKEQMVRSCFSKVSQ